MTNNIQKIREGIERLKSQLLRGACSSQIAMETRCKKEAYNEVLAILDTMQEEPVSDINFEQELYKAFGQVKDFTLGMRIAKWFYDMGKNNQEHVSEDLGEYINELSKQFPEVSFAKLSRIAVRVAKWQGEKDVKKIKTAIDFSFHGGRCQKEEEMLKNAIDVEVKVDAGGYPYIDKTIELYDYDKDVPLAKKGDKYKVVLIKEE